MQDVTRTRTLIIKNTFTVPLPPDDTWKVLINVPEIVSCVPGAELVEQNGDHSYSGRMKVKLGPIAVQFAGTVALEDVNPVKRSAVARAKGTEAKARGGAAATTRFSIAARPGGGSQVDIETDLTLSGMVAQYGRGAGMISALAQQIIDQFAACLSQRIHASASSAAGAALPAAPVAAPKEIGVLSLVARTAFAWLRSLFGRRREQPRRTES
jgi:carbon monoxide dehydrogenase subunit G